MPAGTTVATINALSVSQSSLEILGTVNSIVVKTTNPIRIYGEGLKNTTISNGLDSGEVKVILAESGNSETIIEKDKPLEIDNQGNAVVETYTVKFNSKDGSTVDAITGIKEGATVTLPEAPTKEGFTFIGWFTNEEFITEFTADTPITENITVYAKWEVVVDETKAEVVNQTQLENALNSDVVTDIYFKGDIETDKQILVGKANQVIHGKNYKLLAKTGMTYSEPNKSVLTVLGANGVQISDLSIDAANVNIAEKWDGVYAVQVYDATEVVLDNITLKNADAGLLVNGSEVTVNNITTLGNEFGGIEVSKGSLATSPAMLTVTGENIHNDKVNANIWVITNEGEIIDSTNQYNSAVDGRDGKEDYTNYWNSRENPFPKATVEDPILEAPKDGLKELSVVELKAADVRYLVYGLNEEGKEVQRVSTLEEVKEFIDRKYNATFNTNYINVEDGKISITGSILSTEDWNKVKTNGNSEIPYKITVLLGSEKNTKVAKIAMYQDGGAVIESL